MIQHQCTACKKIYDQGSSEILKGCSCGNKLFYFVNKGRLPKQNDIEYFYEPDENTQEEVLLDTEAINILSEGSYEIDVGKLMNSSPDAIIYSYGEGMYSIDLKCKKI
jgi:predicted  nucleic acid-binding Zn-ribbon protein